jgi:hypothetical protein
VSAREDIAIVREALVIANDANGCSFDQPDAALDRVDAALARVEAEHDEALAELEREQEIAVRFMRERDKLRLFVRDLAALISIVSDGRWDAASALERLDTDEDWQVDVAAADPFVAAALGREGEAPERQEPDDWEFTTERVDPHAVCCAECRARDGAGREGEAAPGSTESGLTAAGGEQA